MYVHRFIQHSAFDIYRYRSACEELLLEHSRFARDAGIEDKLWDRHDKINIRFREQLSPVCVPMIPISAWQADHAMQFRQAEGKNKHVEHRKTAKVFLRFIKSSQHFYRSYVKSLGSRLKDATLLEASANRRTWSGMLPHALY